MKFTDTQVIWETGFKTSNSLMVSVQLNKEGHQCLKFDEWLTDEEVRSVASSRSKETFTNAPTTPATKASEPSATEGITESDAGF